MQLHIRPGTEHELQELIAIQKLAIEAFYSSIHSPEQVQCLITSQSTEMKMSNQSFLVAEINGVAIGFAALSRRALQIDAVYVHPQWMRQGVGKQLVAELEAVALAERYPKLNVVADLTASAFYQMQGYRVLKQFEYWMGNQSSVPCHLLEKQLLPPHVVDIWAPRLMWLVAGLLLCRLGFGVYDRAEKWQLRQLDDMPFQQSHQRR
jgi:putative acetyltransferase